jgi:hypothetical protein
MQKGENEMPSLGCELELRETDASICEFNVAEELVPQGFRNGNDLALPTEFTKRLVASDQWEPRQSFWLAQTLRVAR